MFLLANNPVHKQFPPKGNWFLEPGDGMLKIRRKMHASQIRIDIILFFQKCLRNLFIIHANIQNKSADIFQAWYCKAVLPNTIAQSYVVLA